MTNEDYIKQLHELIDGNIDTFNSAVPGIQNSIADKITTLLKDLDISGGTIANSVKNLRLIGQIKTELKKIVFNRTLRTQIDNFITSFDEVAMLQKNYFKKLNSDFTAGVLLEEIKNQSIEATTQSLTQAGITANVIEPIQAILRQNITTGGSYAQLSNQLREFIVTNESGLGALERYTKQITTDSLNQFSAQYTHAVADSLGYKWFMYTGSLLTTSRAFCEAMVSKKYYHLSELDDIIHGDFDEFDKEGNINPKTDLPKGMIPDTNTSNFSIYRGGYGCGHQSTPVPELAVPKNIRIETYTRLGIAFDADGMAMAA